jgi:hypothetical protein
MSYLKFVRLAMVASVLVPAAVALSAQDRTLFTWTGRVDREVQLVMRGSQLRTRLVGGNESDVNRESVVHALPSRDGHVRIELRDGRGTADVIQQPTSRNDYTTIVRVRDGSSGADSYRLTAYWQGSGRDDTGRWGREDRYGDDTWNDELQKKNKKMKKAKKAKKNGRYGGDDDWDRGRGRNDSDDEWGNGRGRDYSSGSLRWSGRVDDVVEIRIRGNDVDYRTISGRRTFSTRSDFSGSELPQRNETVRVEERQGRGSVTVVQQPNARNGYTAVIRVRDPESGYGSYDFDVTW